MPGKILKKHSYTSHEKKLHREEKMWLKIKDEIEVPYA